MFKGRQWYARQYSIRKSATYYCRILLTRIVSSNCRNIYLFKDHETFSHKLKQNNLLRPWDFLGPAQNFGPPLGNENLSKSVLLFLLSLFYGLKVNAKFYYFCCLSFVQLSKFMFFARKRSSKMLMNDVALD